MTFQRLSETQIVKKISDEHDSNGEPKGEVTSSSFPLRHPYKGIEGIREYAVTRSLLKGMLRS